MIQVAKTKIFESWGGGKKQLFVGISCSLLNNIIRRALPRSIEKIYKKE
ncbi:hypothetical protein D932_00288 [Enterococcus casseliflavus 14-MB-W-14]|nr:hypothetical protein D932_00288 [Enterococcus casseliflavus 14-MB-W-14]